MRSFRLPPRLWGRRDRAATAAAGGDEPAPRLRVAVVFGAAVRPGGVASPALVRRTDHAATLYRDGAVDLVFASGGLGRHPPAEGELMGRRLAARGVPSAALVIDADATTTMATARNVAAWVRTRGEPIAIVGVTDRYHAPRARLALWGHRLAARMAWPAAVRSTPGARLRAWRREVLGLPVYAVRALGCRRRASPAPRPRRRTSNTTTT